MTDPDERIDALLHEYAERWRDAQPDPPATNTSSWTESSRRPSRWWLVPAAAAAVAAVIVGVVLSSPATSPRLKAPPVAGPSATAGHGVVPWKPLPATHPDIATYTVPPSPDPAVAAKAPACRANQLKVTSGGHGGAMGTWYLPITIQLGQGHPCRLEGRPDIRLLNHGQAAAIPLRYGGDWADGYRGPVLVGDGHAARIRLAWGEDWCAPPVSNDQIAVTLPGGNTVRVPGFGHSPICNGGSRREPVTYYSYVPRHVVPGHTTSAFEDVDVSLSGIPRHVRAGSLLNFTVTLTAAGQDVSLDPCPDFTIVEPAPHDEVDEHRFGLNCAGVRHRDSSGRPVLPAGVPVRFAMQARLPFLPAGGVKFSWVLDAPERRSDTVVVFPTNSQPTPSAGATCEPTKVSLDVAGRTVPVPTFPQADQPLRLRMHVGDTLEYDASGNCAYESTISESSQPGGAYSGVFKQTAGEGKADGGTSPGDRSPARNQGGPGSQFKAVEPGTAEFWVTELMCRRPKGSTVNLCIGGLATLRQLDIQVLP